MALQLFAHPFSSYCQKVLIALYEAATPFDYRTLGPDQPEAMAELSALWPLKRFPVLRDGDTAVFEASIIIEHLDIRHPGPMRMIPREPAQALACRALDRVFDNYVMTPMQRIVSDALREPDRRDARGVEEAHALLEETYAWLDRALAEREWATGDDFSLADCAAAPSLFYADWVHPIGDAYATLRAYRRRLLARPSVARCVDEARPYRALFPPGAPDRD